MINDHCFLVIDMLDTDLPLELFSSKISIFGSAGIEIEQLVSSDFAYPSFGSKR